jgi:hypothetical protein
MGIAGIGSALSAVDTQYNFTSMTNQQLLDASNTLFSEGKISESDADQLSQIAQGVDSVPISGPSQSVSQTLSDSTQHDFIAQLQGDDYSANLAGSVGGDLYNSTLAALQSYQATSVENTSTLISTQA